MKPAYVASLRIRDGGEPSLSQVLSACFSTSEKTYSFLRWPHQVSGIQVGIPADPVCSEGQVFSQQGELRWKSTPHGWDLLYLGIQAPPDSFIPLPGEWRWEDHPADLYGSQSQETRFPKLLSHPKDLRVGQRYFRDERTARVHFIALIPR